MSKATLIVPGQEVFRSLYDQTIPKLQNYDSINTKWHAQVGDAVFESVCLALADTISGERRMHTVSAAIGAGKTSFAIASLVAQAQWSELDRKAPHGAVLVVEQIRRAEELYRQLNALWPGKVAVWTTEHDPKCTAWPTLGKKPEATFTRQQLQDYPVIVVTHKFYQDVNYQRARTVVRNGVASKRALTIVDERPDEAPMLEIELSLAQKVREKLVDRYPEIKERLDPLFLFMEEQSYAERNKIVRPKKQETKTLAWFQSYDADELAQTAKDIPGMGDLFDYAKLLQTGRALATTSQTATHYWGYESRLIVDRSAGVVLLDATLNIDGINSIVTWPVETKVPKATYGRLEIVHVPQHHKGNLKTYLETAEHQRAYKKHIEDIVIQHMEPGQKGLVVCKKAMFDHEHIPWWPKDPRFQDPASYTERYEWDLYGRKLCATHWGSGVGSNTWKDADVVFLFDDFIRPRRVSISKTQGLREHRVHEGALNTISVISSATRRILH